MGVDAFQFACKVEGTMPKRIVDKKAINQLLNDVQNAFPHLKMRLASDHPHVDLNLDIPQQSGLKFNVNINLQGDELHLSAGHFWLEWFPCSDAGVVETFREAVRGLLSGEFRILEYYRGRRAIKAELQRPSGDGWKTIGTWSALSLPVPWRVTTKELRNIAATA